MSWATVIEDNEGLDGIHTSTIDNARSEEAVLHGLRTAYNSAMQNIGLYPAGSSEWVQAVKQLEAISGSCSLYVDSISSARIQLHEISYLAKRNLVECMSKNPSGDTSICYQLILDTINVMMELDKEDLSLILLAARYAKKLDDIWTYKQLILLHQHKLPYMYKDLFMADFEQTVNHEWNKCNSNVRTVDVVLPEIESMGQPANRTRFSDSALRVGAQDQFVSFVSQKILAKQGFSDESIMNGFLQEWLAPVEDEEMDVPSASPSADQATARDNGETHVMTTDVGIESEMSLCVGEPALDESQVATTAAETSEAVITATNATAGQVSRRSGRAAKKTDPSSWEDRALQTAIEASKTVARVPSQSQLSRGTSGSDEASNISEIKKILQKSVFPSDWSASFAEDADGLRALHYAFALPTTILETPEIIAAARCAGASHVTSHMATTCAADDEVSDGVGEDQSSVFNYASVAVLFSAFVRLVRSRGALSHLTNLHVAFIQTVAGAVCSKTGARELFADLDCAVLQSWRSLTSAHQSSVSSLLARVNEKEELLLLECSLSVIQCDQTPASNTTLEQNHRVALRGQAFEILQHLLPRSLSSASTSGLSADSADVNVSVAPFWQRYTDKTHQLRVLWAAVAASRFFGVDTLSSSVGTDATTVDLLSILIGEITRDTQSSLSVWLPHVFDKQQQLISAQTCRDLQDTIKYEAEVRDLLSSFNATRGWVQGVLEQIRLGERLQSLLGFRQQQQQSKENDSSAPQSIPLLLLEACRTLKDFSLWMEVAEVVIGAVIAKASLSDGILSGPWMADLFTSMLLNVPAVSQPVDSALVASLSTSIAVLLYFNGTTLLPTSDTLSIMLSCIRVHEEIDQCGRTGEVSRLIFSNTVLQVLFAQSQRVLESSTITAVAPDAALSVLCALWSQFSKLMSINGAAFLSRLSESAWNCLTRVVVEVWAALDTVLSKDFRTVLLSVFLNLLSSASSLAVSCKGEVLVHCHFEILDNALHLADAASCNLRKKRKREPPAAAVPPMPRVTVLLRAALEELVFDIAFEANFAQRVQREIIFVLGQVYSYSFGFPMVPLDSSGSSSSDDDESRSSEDESRSCTRFDGNDAALLYKLFTFSKVCIKGGWVNRAEIRSSLFMLARADAFKSSAAFSTTKSIFEHIFAVDPHSEHELVEALQLDEQSEQRNDGNTSENAALVRSVGTELFFTLLQLGLPPAEIDEGEEGDPGTDTMTTLQAQCDLGLFLRDRNQGAVVELCLLDLAFNPFRFSSWHLLLMQFMEAFNALMDELQKLVLMDALPAACYSFVLPQYLALLRPFASIDDNAMSLWRLSAPIPQSVTSQLLDSAVTAVMSACDAIDLVKCFECALAAETFFNLNRSADSTDYEVHLRKVCHLLSVRNACFHVYQKVSRFMDVAVSSGRIVLSDESERALWHTQAETGVLTLSNAAKCYAKKSEHRLIFKEASLSLVSQDNHFDDDLYALTCSAKLVWQLAQHAALSNITHAASQFEALTICLRAVQVLKGENAKVYSKPVRLSVLYQVSSICLKAALCLVQAFVVEQKDPQEHANFANAFEELSIIEKCMTTILPAKAIASVPVAAPAAVFVSVTSSTSNRSDTPQQLKEKETEQIENEEYDEVKEPPSVQVRVWAALQLAFAGLKECRRLDAFDFKSVFRVARGISKLSEMLQRAGGDLTVPVGAMASLLELLGIRELSQAAALEELARVFDRKRSQIVAMWCVENAVSPWEKTLVRISQFDTLRKKFIDEYLRLAVTCRHLEVVLDVVAFALSALKHATAVVLHTLQAGVKSLRSIILELLTLLQDNSAETGEQDPLPSATSGDLCEPVQQRESLCKEATRWLHVAFELYYQLQPFASDRTKADLEDILLALYPYSSVFVAPLPQAPATSPAVEDESAVTGMSMDIATDVVHTTNAINSATSEAAQYPLQQAEALTAKEVLALCADKWGRPKQPRSDLGKRAKGYFVTRSASASAALTVTAAETVSAAAPVEPSTAEAEIHVPAIFIAHTALEDEEMEQVLSGSEARVTEMAAKETEAAPVKQDGNIPTMGDAFEDKMCAEDEEGAHTNKTARFI